MKTPSLLTTETLIELAIAARGPKQEPSTESTNKRTVNPQPQPVAGASKLSA